MQEKFRILSSKGFVIALAVLLLNDFIFKATFHNWFTGKLSDVAGLFIFPMFWTAFFPKQKKTIYFLTALFFIFWKSPFSQSFIDTWNELNLLSIHRVVDYSDLIALLILPFSFQYSANENRKAAFAIHPFILIFIASFSFVATSKYNRVMYGDLPFYSDPVKYGQEIKVDGKPYTFEMRPADITPLLNSYNIIYLDQLSSDSVLYFQAFKGYDSLPPLVKVINRYTAGKTIIQVRSVIFDTAQLHKKDDVKHSYYKTENATLFARNFEGWFMTEFRLVYSCDSLNKLGASLWKTHPDSSISVYNAAIKIAPQWINTKKMLYFGLGNAYFFKQQYQQALVYFYRADSLNSLYSSYRMRADPYYGLADTYKKLGQKDSVKKYKKLAANGYPR